MFNRNIVSFKDRYSYDEFDSPMNLYDEILEQSLSSCLLASPSTDDLLDKLLSVLDYVADDVSSGIDDYGPVMASVGASNESRITEETRENRIDQCRNESCVVGMEGVMELPSTVDVSQIVQGCSSCTTLQHRTALMKTAVIEPMLNYVLSLNENSKDSKILNGGINCSSVTDNDDASKVLAVDEVLQDHSTEITLESDEKCSCRPMTMRNNSRCSGNSRTASVECLTNDTRVTLSLTGLTAHGAVEESYLCTANELLIGSPVNGQKLRKKRVELTSSKGIVELPSTVGASRSAETSQSCTTLEQMLATIKTAVIKPVLVDVDIKYCRRLKGVTSASTAARRPYSSARQDLRVNTIPDYQLKQYIDACPSKTKLKRLDKNKCKKNFGTMTSDNYDTAKVDCSGKRNVKSRKTHSGKIVKREQIYSGKNRNCKISKTNTETDAGKNVPLEGQPNMDDDTHNEPGPTQLTGHIGNQELTVHHGIAIDDITREPSSKRNAESDKTYSCKKVKCKSRCSGSSRNCKTLKKSTATNYRKDVSVECLLNLEEDTYNKLRQTGHTMTGHNDSGESSINHTDEISKLSCGNGVVIKRKVKQPKQDNDEITAKCKTKIKRLKDTLNCKNNSRAITQTTNDTKVIRVDEYTLGTSTEQMFEGDKKFSSLELKKLQKNACKSRNCKTWKLNSAVDGKDVSVEYLPNTEYNTGIKPLPINLTEHSGGEDYGMFIANELLIGSQVNGKKLRRKRVELTSSKGIVELPSTVGTSRAAETSQSCTTLEQILTTVETAVLKPVLRDFDIGNEKKRGGRRLNGVTKASTAARRPYSSARQDLRVNTILDYQLKQYIDACPSKTKLKRLGKNKCKKNFGTMASDNSGTAKVDFSMERIVDEITQESSSKRNAESDKTYSCKKVKCKSRCSGTSLNCKTLKKSTATNCKKDVSVECLLNLEEDTHNKLRQTGHTMTGYNDSGESSINHTDEISKLSCGNGVVIKRKVKQPKQDNDEITAICKTKIKRLKDTLNCKKNSRAITQTTNDTKVIRVDEYTLGTSTEQMFEGDKKCSSLKSKKLQKNACKSRNCKTSKIHYADDGKDVSVEYLPNTEYNTRFKPRSIEHSGSDGFGRCIANDLLIDSPVNGINIKKLRRIQGTFSLSDVKLYRTRRNNRNVELTQLAADSRYADGFLGVLIPSYQTNEFWKNKVKKKTYITDLVSEYRPNIDDVIPSSVQQQHVGQRLLSNFKRRRSVVNKDAFAAFGELVQREKSADFQQMDFMRHQTPTYLANRAISDCDRCTNICRVKPQWIPNKHTPEYHQVISTKIDHNKTAVICMDSNSIAVLPTQFVDTGNGTGTRELVGLFVDGNVHDAPSQAMEPCSMSSHNKMFDLTTSQVAKSFDKLCHNEMVLTSSRDVDPDDKLCHTEMFLTSNQDVESDETLYDTEMFLTSSRDVDPDDKLCHTEMFLTSNQDVESDETLYDTEMFLTSSRDVDPDEKLCHDKMFLTSSRDVNDKLMYHDDIINLTLHEEPDEDTPSKTSNAIFVNYSPIYDLRQAAWKTVNPGYRTIAPKPWSYLNEVTKKIGKDKRDNEIGQTGMAPVIDQHSDSKIGEKKIDSEVGQTSMAPVIDQHSDSKIDEKKIDNEVSQTTSVLGQRGDCFLDQNADQDATGNQPSVSQDPPLVAEVARDSPKKQRNCWLCFECRSTFVDFNLFRLHVAGHRCSAERSRLVDGVESPLQRKISVCERHNSSSEAEAGCPRCPIVQSKTSSLTECPVCGKCVRRLRAHMIVHSTARPYTCNDCCRTFKKLPHLTKHITTCELGKSSRSTRSSVFLKVDRKGAVDGHC